MSLLAALESTDFVMIALASVSVMVVLIVVAGGRSSLDKTIERLAAGLQARFVPGGPFGEPWIELDLSGRSARVQFSRGGRFEPPSTRIVVDVRGVSPGWLHILPNRIGEPFLKVFGGRDLTVGDPVFDLRYVVAATPEHLAARVFRAEQRARAVAAVMSLQDLAQHRIDLDQNQFTVELRGALTDRQLMSVLTAAGDLLACILHEPPPEGVLIGDLSAATQGRCPVCGTGMVDDVVRCEACRTPHHAECWRYMGRCSTYACKGRRAAA